MKSNKRHNMLVLSVALMISVFLLFLKKKGPAPYAARIFRSSVAGWGYEILVKGKLFIHQESIPACSGETGFPEKIQAERTAELIINKIKNGQHPAVTTFELKQIMASKH